MSHFFESGSEKILLSRERTLILKELYKEFDKLGHLQVGVETDKYNCEDLGDLIKIGFIKIGYHYTPNANLRAIIAPTLSGKVFLNKPCGTCKTIEDIIV